MRQHKEIKELMKSWEKSDKAEGFYYGDQEIHGRIICTQFSAINGFEQAFVFARDEGFPNWEEILAIKNAIWGEQEIVYFRYNSECAMCHSFMTMVLTHNTGDDYGKPGAPLFSPLKARNVQICCDNGIPFITHEESDEIDKELDMVMRYTGLTLNAIKNLRALAELRPEISPINDVMWLLENSHLGEISNHIKALLAEAGGAQED